MLRTQLSIKNTNVDRHLSQSWMARRLGSTVSDAPAMKVAIVGSGPAGCYTAKYLVQSVSKVNKSEGNGPGGVHIDILEKLPTPFGLVRSGVAPDHPEVKNVQNDFSDMFDKYSSQDGTTDNIDDRKARASVSFFGNVHVGEDISLQELREMYDVVVLAYGCQSDRKLGIPGEDTLSGVLCAREFVSWYNGHPDFVHIGEIVRRALGDDPSQASVVVVGQGNVALDCARILAKGRDGLDETDISSHTLDAIGPGVQKTTVVGRRGHVQAAFTIKELRELVNLKKDGHDTDFRISQQELDLGTTEASQEELSGKGSRPKIRLDKVLREAAKVTTAANDDDACNKSVEVRFLLNPVRFEPPNHQDRDEPIDGNRLGAVVCERTRLEGEPFRQSAVGTGTFETFRADLVRTLRIRLDHHWATVRIHLEGCLWCFLYPQGLIQSLIYRLAIIRTGTRQYRIQGLAPPGHGGERLVR